MNAVLEVAVDSMPRPFDRDAVVALQRGDRRARERFFDHFYDRVFDYIVHSVRDEHLAEDLTHEVFLKLNAALDRLDPNREPSSFVFTVAANAIRDHWRRRETKARQASISWEDVHDPPRDGKSGVDDVLVLDEDHARVHRAMATLSDDDRQVLLLRTFGELDTPDVASVLGIRADAVRQRWSRAVRRLGDAYRALDAAEGGAS